MSDPLEVTRAVLVAMDGALAVGDRFPATRLPFVLLTPTARASAMPSLLDGGTIQVQVCAASRIEARDLADGVRAALWGAQQHQTPYPGIGSIARLEETQGPIYLAPDEGEPDGVHRYALGFKLTTRP